MCRGRCLGRCSGSSTQVRRISGNREKSAALQRALSEQYELARPNDACKSSGRHLSPFGKRCITVQPEVGSTGEMTVEGAVIMDGRVNGNDFRKRGTASEALHGPLSSSQRLMGNPCPTAPPTRGVLSASHAVVRERRSVNSQPCLPLARAPKTNTPEAMPQGCK